MKLTQKQIELLIELIDFELEDIKHDVDRIGRMGRIRNLMSIITKLTKELSLMD